MKAVSGGMLWTVITIVVGIVAIALLIVFVTGAGNAVVGMFSGLTDAFSRLTCTIIGRIPLVGSLMGC
jgi:Flp pilus assembly pilin Flp